VRRSRGGRTQRGTKQRKRSSKYGHSVFQKGEKYTNYDGPNVVINSYILRMLLKGDKMYENICFLSKIHLNKEI
jgi:hypothetical protein